MNSPTGPTASEARAIGEAVPPVRPRRRARPSRTAPDTFLWVYDDPGRGLALLRGKKVTLVLKMAGMTERVRWSAAGRGWVIGTDDLADLLALADDVGTPYRIKAVGES